jgi:hypothetical protein
MTAHAHHTHSALGAGGSLAAMAGGIWAYVEQAEISGTTGLVVAFGGLATALLTPLVPVLRLWLEQNNLKGLLEEAVKDRAQLNERVAALEDKLQKETEKVVEISLEALRREGTVRREDPTP